MGKDPPILEDAKFLNTRSSYWKRRVRGRPTYAFRGSLARRPAALNIRKKMPRTANAHGATFSVRVRLSICPRMPTVPDPLSLPIDALSQVWQKGQLADSSVCNKSRSRLSLSSSGLKADASRWVPRAWCSNSADIISESSPRS